MHFSKCMKKKQFRCKKLDWGNLSKNKKKAHWKGVRYVLFRIGQVVVL